MNMHTPADWSRALSIRAEVLAATGVPGEELLGRGQRPHAVRARQDIAYRAYVECLALSSSDIADLIGRTDHTAAMYAILQGARRAGRDVSRISQLRDLAPDPVDWTKLAYAASGHRAANDLSLVEASQQAALSRAEWRKIERGARVSAGSVLLACRAIGADPFSLLLNVTRQTAVKHPGEAA